MRLCARGEEGGETGHASRVRLAPRALRAASVLGATFLACVTTWTPPDPSGYHRTDPVVRAGSPVGAQECFACHDSFGDHRISSAAHEDCEACHGAGGRHAFTARAVDIRYPSNDDCAACHGSGSRTLLGWTRSEHARTGVLCTDCHDTHGSEIRLVRTASSLSGAMLRHAGGTTRMCTTCHREVAAQFDLPSHHPMREGMLGCTDCHPPHEGPGGAPESRTARCASCHQSVTGPWIYEHAPVTEDCGYCHNPHGATSDFLLEISQPGACINCHSIPVAGATHDPWAFTTRCTDCHNAVHGSYSDPHLRR